jgi:hypothetical protein
VPIVLKCGRLNLLEPSGLVKACNGVALPLLFSYLLLHAASPSWEANHFAASQELPRVLWNPKVHYHIHKCPPPLSILSQLKPAHISHPTYWRSILILFSHLRLGLPDSLFPSGFPTKTLYTPLPSPIRTTCSSISFFSISSPAHRWVRNTDHGALYDVSSTPLLPRPSSAQILSSIFFISVFVNKYCWQRMLFLYMFFIHMWAG